MMTKHYPNSSAFARGKFGVKNGLAIVRRQPKHRPSLWGPDLFGSKGLYLDDNRVRDNPNPSIGVGVTGNVPGPQLGTVTYFIASEIGDCP